MYGFKQIWFTPDEVAQIITACEERLLKDQTITTPFSVADIQGGVLKEHLIEEDYLTPKKVFLLFSHSTQESQQLTKPWYQNTLKQHNY